MRKAVPWVSLSQIIFVEISQKKNYVLKRINK